jgi:hypothetical protein
MILKEIITIKVNSNHLKYYRNLGYEAKMSDTLDINSLHLPKGSHVRVNAECDKCGKIENIEFRGVRDKINFTYECKSCIHKDRISKNGSVFRNPVLQSELSLRNNKKSLDKRKETKLNKHGDQNYNNPEKRKETLKRKHGDETYNNQKKRKETKLNKHGDENYNNQEKKEETCLLKYGVRHTNQIPEIWEKIQKSSFRVCRYKDTDLTYQGDYELDFLEFCESNSIKVNNGPSLSYNFNKKNRVYHSDFIIDDLNLIIEIKSTYTLNSDLECNLEKEKECKKRGYNFMFIVDKNYDNLIEYLSLNHVTGTFF